jgi:hypothetical protein
MKTYDIDLIVALHDGILDQAAYALQAMDNQGLP